MSERHSMRKVREVLRLKHAVGLSKRKTATAAGIAPTTVGDYLSRAKAAGLTWEIARELSDAEVEERLFHQVGRNEPLARAPIDFNWVHMELRRPGVTRQLLWTEYVEGVASGSAGGGADQESPVWDLYGGERGQLPTP